MTARIVAIDVETAPLLAWSFQTRNVFISPDHIKEPGRMICFAAKFNDRRSVEFYSEHKDGHLGMVQQLARILDECDAVLHYNGARFDEEWFRTEIITNGIDMPAPFQTIDLYQQTKKFRADSHKLEWMSTYLFRLDQGKEGNGGWRTWRAILEHDDEKAWKLMEKYNRRDVTVLWEAYDAALPWLVPPNAQLYGAPREACPRCGSLNVQWRGFKRTTTRRYHQGVCNDCRGWFRSTRIDPDDLHRAASLVAVA